MDRRWRRVKERPIPRIAVIVLLAAFFVSAIGAQCASAYTTLGPHLRRQILRSADLPAPDGKTIRRPACIAGRLSSVDKRWAMVFLTNSNACVRRYGGASGGATLLRRPSATSTEWKAVGEIGETCPHRQDGATDRVLRDLGCSSFEPSNRREAAPFLLMRAQPVITSHGVGRVRLGATIGALSRRHLIGRLRQGCELDTGQRVAPLRAPLAGWAIFEGGKRRLTSISIEGGAETARGIGIGSTAAAARAAYPNAEWLSPRRMYPLPVGLLWVNSGRHPKFGILVDPDTFRVESISIPSPNFCE
jgi:hypothetical protein